MNCQNNPCVVPVGKVYATLSNSGSAPGNSKDNSVPIGKHFSNLKIKDTVSEIVNPDDNKNGVVIRTCGVNGSSKSVGLQLYADTQPPAAYGDGSRRLVFFTVSPPAENIKHPLYLPPGHGLWFAPHDEGSICITYDFLDESAA